MTRDRAFPPASCPGSPGDPPAVGLPAAEFPAGARPGPLVSLAGPAGRVLGAAAASRVAPRLERALGLDRINAVYERCAAQPLSAAGTGGAREFVRRLLADLGVEYDVAPADLARIPKRGPVVVVANHPFGGLDGLILAAVVAEARDDVRVMANHLVGRIPELRDLFVLVDPFGGPGAAAANLAPIRQGLRWLKDGHLLAAFPAGEVAHLSVGGLRSGDRRRAGEPAVTDPAWSPTIAALARRAGATVVPVYFEGHNDALFQAAGLLHPRLRTALLPRAMLARRGTRVTLRVGSVVPAKRAAGFDTDAALTDYLRRRTFLLRHGAPRPSIPTATSIEAATTAKIAEAAKLPELAVVPASRVPGLAMVRKQLGRAIGRGNPSAPAAVEPIVPEVPVEALEADLAALPPDALLLAHEGMAVYAARAPQLRNVLREVGRLREVTFRQVGEGTGRALDLDTFDYDYTHLFIWDRQARRVVGAYRLGQTDALLPAKGRQGLYTSTLFNYKAALLRRLDPALEMGRSFVRPEYQKSYAPLLLLWKGIGHYLVRNPKYRYLFGPVSISNSYQTVSRRLMVEFLRQNHAMPEGEALAKPRNPFDAGSPFRRGRRGPRLGKKRWADAGLRRLLADDDEVSDLIADLEPDHKGIPVLVRQYLKLGAKFLAFNVDRAFGDCLDGLIVVDLLHTEPRVLERYMTKDGYASFVAHLQDRAEAMAQG